MQNLERTDIKYLPGAGPKRAEILDKELDVKTFRDLAYLFPARYADRSRIYAIRDLRPDLPAVQVKGRFICFNTVGEGARKRLVASFTDGQSFMEVVWFSGLKFLKGRYQVGKEYMLFGKPNLFQTSISMVHPEVEEYNPERPVEGLRGIYSLSEQAKKKISSRQLHTLVDNLFHHNLFSTLKETLPTQLVEEAHLMPLREAIVNIHLPSNANLLRKARERMKFEELFYLELNILRYSQKASKQSQGHILPKVGDCFNTFFSRILPFELTGAQKRVIKEIRSDMLTGHQMNRLLQGDVGSGKTMVAFMTMLLAIDNGLQAALMAPTEILATQHYESLLPWCSRLGIACRLLKGSTPQREKQEILQQLQEGQIQIIIGTHALIEERVKFRSLGVAVIDEQHRFGVAQRAKMWIKGEIAPHILVMTATPIPRTLAMTLYGDLEVSIIDELPPGRKPIETRLFYSNRHHECDRLIYSQLRLGHQIYIVYPLIYESDKIELQSLEKGYEDVCRRFPDYRVAYVHGQMKADEKAHQMDLFATGQAQILVATTVIEVGVNIPNASVMVIEDAERFGLSQLHQLRGRVGRGADQSYCILMAKEEMSPPTRQRLSAMTRTTDGFELAEVDLKMRGPGDLEGTMQSGMPIQLKVASLVTDGQLIAFARQEAMKAIERGWLDSDPTIRHELDYRFSNDPHWREIS